MSVVFWKELADHFSSRRFMILLIIIILSGFWATYATGQAIRQNTDTVPAQYVFLLLLTSSVASAGKKTISEIRMAAAVIISVPDLSYVENVSVAAFV